ncbi:MAG: hypothetical protein Q8Q03_00680, partial [bacterium]|nr:hypothetical protein [bacterium]
MDNKTKISLYSKIIGLTLLFVAVTFSSHKVLQTYYDNSVTQTAQVVSALNQDLCLLRLTILEKNTLAKSRTGSTFVIQAAQTTPTDLRHLIRHNNGYGDMVLETLSSRSEKSAYIDQYELFSPRFINAELFVDNGTKGETFETAEGVIRTIISSPFAIEGIRIKTADAVHTFLVTKKSGRCGDTMSFGPAQVSSVAQDTPADTAPLCGDVNGSGTVTTLDISLIRKHILDLEPLS